MYGTQIHPGAPYYANQPYPAPGYPDPPQDIRPLITRHRLRRQRRRKAATLLTGASIAFGIAALRPSNASAHAPATHTPVTRTHDNHDSPHNAAPD
jgi:hypothetical protein